MKRFLTVFALLFFTGLPFVQAQLTEIVWPGDANHDGHADIFDILTLGIKFGHSGPVRPNATINWQGEPAPNWGTDTLWNGIPTSHADCNGDGIVNLGDLVAIHHNIGKTHDTAALSSNMYPMIPGTMGNPWLRFMPVIQDTLHVSDTLTLTLILGQMGMPTNFYGLAFTLRYTSSLIDSGSVHMTLDSSTWIGVPSALLTFDKDFYQQGSFTAAITKLNHQNSYGNGPIARISFIMEQNIAGKNLDAIDTLTISFANVVLIDSAEVPIPVYADSVSFIVVDPSADLPPVKKETPVRVYPNPARQMLTISGSNIQEVQLLDLCGRLVTVPVTYLINEATISLQDISPGIYLVHVLAGNAWSARKISIQ